MAVQPITNATFRALGRDQRRQFLLTLQDHDSAESVDVRSLLSARDADEEYVRMRHVHLPLLNDLDYVRWDPETNEVGKGPRFVELEPILELLRIPIAQ